MNEESEKLNKPKPKPKTKSKTLTCRVVAPGLFSSMVFLVGWLAGIVLAKGFVSTAFAIIFFPYAFYLVVERIMIAIGMV